MHFCESTARLYGRLSVPRNTSLNCTIPELVKSRVESPPGTSDIEGTAVCPCSTKKSMNVWRISLPVNFLLIRAPSVRVKLVAELYQRWITKSPEPVQDSGPEGQDSSLKPWQVQRAVPGSGLHW